MCCTAKGKDVKKRFFDLALILVLLPILIPLIAFVSLLVRIKLGAPMFFQQERAGLNGKAFMMIKFRTMTNSRDAEGNLLPNEERKTKFGEFLRSTSLDELPELWNVFKGDMSLVGPRPLLVDYLSLYSEYENRRHEVKPGITGWAQVNGRNSISWEDKFELDVWYVDNQSLWLDFKILWLTVKKVVIRDGINNSADIAMPRFTGTKKIKEKL
jgi:sugar transferase EpsL